MKGSIDQNIRLNSPDRSYFSSPEKAPALRHSSILAANLSAEGMSVYTFATMPAPGVNICPCLLYTISATESLRYPSACFLSVITTIFVIPWSFITRLSNSE